MNSLIYNYIVGFTESGGQSRTMKPGIGPLLVSFILLGFMTASSDAADPKCPEEWEVVHRGCYKFVTTESPWMEANEYCKGAHGELASIQSISEKEELEKRLNEKYGSNNKWWVGFERDERDKGKWNWLAGIPLNDQITPWTNYRLKRRPGNMCGMIEMAGELKVAVTRCTSAQPFICEYHTIAPRPESTPPPTTPPTTTSDTNGFPNDGDEGLESALGASGRSEPSLGTSERSESSYTSPNEWSVPCRPENGAAGSGLYQRYLQSQIEANEAKIAYYAEVSKVYEEALAAQKRYYDSHQVMVDLQTEQIREGKICK